MRTVRILFLALLFGFVLGGCRSYKTEEAVISYRVSPEKISMHYLDEAGAPYGGFEHFIQALEQKGKKLIFGINGGMYLSGLIPQGLYIERGRLIHEIDRAEEGYGNFYMKPNGIFSIDFNGTAHITTVEKYQGSEHTAYATQSGPMLVIDGKMHPRFIPDSKWYHYRSGVGILPDGRLLFGISSHPIRFYDFAMFFIENNCSQALYLDGSTSARIYYPEKGITKDMDVFAIIIAQVKEEE